jgi:branched-chain amino acid transport system ATP-binding protein
VPPVLEVTDLSVSYGPVRAVKSVSLHVDEGEAVCLIGANGAGKTTTLNAIAGLLRPGRGSVVFRGRDIRGLRTSAISKSGLVLVPEGRHVLPSLTVEENLVAGTFAAGARRESFDAIYELFPILGERRTQPAATLSGGEQQMLVIGRALAGQPSLLLLDEPSMGLAPIVVRTLFGAIAEIIERGTTVLLVEQNARMALALANRGYVMVLGQIAASGDAGQLRSDKSVQEAYFGSSEGLSA